MLVLSTYQQAQTERLKTNSNPKYEPQDPPPPPKLATHGSVAPKKGETLRLHQFSKPSQIKTKA